MLKFNPNKNIDSRVKLDSEKNSKKKLKLMFLLFTKNGIISPKWKKEIKIKKINGENQQTGPDSYAKAHACSNPAPTLPVVAKAIYISDSPEPKCF